MAKELDAQNDPVGNGFSTELPISENGFSLSTVLDSLDPPKENQSERKRKKYFCTLKCILSKTLVGLVFRFHMLCILIRSDL